MSVGPVTSFVIEDKVAADKYLAALFENPDFKSMDEVQRRASSYITDPRVKQYFIGKAKACLATDFEEITFTDADLNKAKRKAADWIKQNEGNMFPVRQSEKTGAVFGNPPDITAWTVTVHYVSV